MKDCDKPRLRYDLITRLSIVLLVLLVILIVANALAPEATQQALNDFRLLVDFLLSRLGEALLTAGSADAG